MTVPAADVGRLDRLTSGAVAIGVGLLGFVGAMAHAPETMVVVESGGCFAVRLVPDVFWRVQAVAVVSLVVVSLGFGPLLEVLLE